MSNWIEIYYVGKKPLIPPSAISSNDLSIGWIESSDDPLEPLSGDPLTVDDLERYTRIATAARAWAAGKVTDEELREVIEQCDN